jgi:homoserine dehydrogenase
MKEVNIGLVGLGTIGGGTLHILAENAVQIEAKLGFRLRVKAVCDLMVDEKEIPTALGDVEKTQDWRRVATHPDVDIVVELVGGTTIAGEIIETAIANKKSIVTANKALMGLRGAEIWDQAITAGVNLAMEASVAGGIPVHAVLREGISGDRMSDLYGILNGTCNYIMTEIEDNGTPFDEVLAEAQRLGYAEADPSADVDGHDARSKLALLSALAFGERITPEDIFLEGIRRITPMDFQYADRLDHTIRLIAAARQTPAGLILSVRPSLIPKGTILAHVKGVYNAVWVRGHFGDDSLYYGQGAGPRATGVAVVSDLMRVGREIQHGAPERVSPFAHERLGKYKPIPVTLQERAFFLRFRVKDQPGIIAKLGEIMAAKGISLDAVLQVPCDTKDNLPFVITIEPSREESVREAVKEMSTLDFMVEPPLALPMETSL